MSLESSPSQSRSIRQRTCIGCRDIAHSSQLLRVVADGAHLCVDPQAALGGRGAWIHPRTTCVQQAKDKRAFARAFRCAITDTSELTTWLNKNGCSVNPPDREPQ